ncbi:hypothetical protein HOLleu_41196 [Holothuria leucospilota]|uniref:Uncharacterized protein n=1 Tax=Holothuria leucospilota TaxID=206669 RepID=A0A9Q0YC81_HOLLE|nr:hypothetical protein HOLleu_41196 [Holothuria leucospilota]
MRSTRHGLPFLYFHSRFCVQRFNFHTESKLITVLNVGVRVAVDVHALTSPVDASLGVQLQVCRCSPKKVNDAS